MSVLETCTGLQHIGIPTDDINKTTEFFKKLGFKTELETVNPNTNSKVVFLSVQNTVIEVWEEKEVAHRPGAVDHIALDVSDVEAAYKKAKEDNFSIIEDDIQFLPFWDKGVRFFTILGPNDEKIECNQRLA